MACSLLKLDGGWQVTPSITKFLSLKNSPKKTILIFFSLLNFILVMVSIWFQILSPDEFHLIGTNFKSNGQQILVFICSLVKQTKSEDLSKEDKFNFLRLGEFHFGDFYQFYFKCIARWSSSNCGKWPIHQNLVSICLLTHQTNEVWRFL